MPTSLPQSPSCSIMPSGFASSDRVLSTSSRRATAEVKLLGREQVQGLDRRWLASSCIGFMLRIGP